MTSAIAAFETTIALSAIAFVSFLLWWAFDACHTAMALEAARERLKQVALNASARISPDELSIKLQEALSRDHSEGHEDFFVLLASLYILRQELDLKCTWFAKQLSDLPPAIREQLNAGKSHIRKEDVKGLLLPKAPRILGREITSLVASRLEDNITDLKRDTASSLRCVAEPQKT